MNKPAAEPKRFFPVLKRLTAGMAITLLLMAGTKSLEKTSLGHRIETSTFEALQWPLSSFAQDLPVVVVDMSQIPGGNDQVTSRAALRQTLAAIVAQKPSAVGIDVDFSPDLDGWKDDDDPAFFDFCLKLKHDNNVPIFLGVYRTIGEQPKTWLGLDQYKELAAALTATDDTMRLPLWLQARDSNEKLLTLSGALAVSYRPSLLEPRSGQSWFVEVTKDKTAGIEQQGEDQMMFALTPVNYSKLEEIQHDTVRETKPEFLAGSGNALRGKMVLLGNAIRFDDPFLVPGRDRPVAGVYLFACVAYTLVAAPLYQLNLGLRIALDLVISILIILIVEALRVRYVKVRPGSQFFNAQSMAIWIAIVAVTLLGFIMTSWFSVVWFDFPLVAFALLLHPRIEHRLSKVWKKLRGKTPRSDRSTS